MTKQNNTLIVSESSEKRFFTKTPARTPNLLPAGRLGPPQGARYHWSGSGPQFAHFGPRATTAVRIRARPAALLD